MSLGPIVAEQAEVNARTWSAGGFVPEYDTRALVPAEVLILARHRETLSGRVLDVGCGAGRLLGYLVQLGAEAHGIDISATMVDHCRRRFPGLDIRLGDLADLRASVQGPFDALLMSDNVLDVFDDARRRAVLADARSLLAPGGLLVFSSHNLARWDADARSRPASPRGSIAPKLSFAVHKLASKPPAWALHAIVRLPRRRANRKRLAPLQSRAADHAVINDSAHDYALLHYYIRRADQERQLSEIGFRLAEVLEFDGSAVPDGVDGTGSSLYYVAALN